MKILHISDNHAKVLKSLPEADLLIHTGDGLKNFAWANAEIDIPKQLQWVKYNKIKSSCPVVCVRGNHDFIPFSNYFDAESVFEFTNPSIKEILGIKIAGTRGTKMWSSCTWSDSIDEADLSHLLGHFDASSVDVLMTHGPAYGELDHIVNNESIGSISARDWLLNRAVGKGPNLHLFGHIHEDFGFGRPLRSDLLSVNSATGWHLIEKVESGWEVTDQGKV